MNGSNQGLSGSQQVVQPGNQPLVCPVRGLQGDMQPAFPFDTLPFTPEDGYIGPAEAVDGLLGVPNNEKLLAIVQQGNQVPLPLIGVLKLVHQDGLDQSPPVGEHGLVFPQELQGASLQVVKIQRVPVALEGL
jgi:hypothetical protein